MGKLHEKIERMIDANLNRAREGLRVVEDIARFILDSEELTERVKSLRSEIAKIEKSGNFTLNRDTENDVGVELSSEIEQERADIIDIFNANIKRVQESLRVLEEAFKLIDIEKAKKFKSMRYETYKIEKAMVSLLGEIHQ